MLIDITLGQDYTDFTMTMQIYHKSNVWEYVFKRVLTTIVAFLLISLMISVIVDIGDNMVYLPSNILPMEEIMQLAEKYHWNESFFVKYIYWLGDFFTGDWGVSLYSNYSK